MPLAVIRMPAVRQRSGAADRNVDSDIWPGRRRRGAGGSPERVNRGSRRRAPMVRASFGRRIPRSVPDSSREIVDCDMPTRHANCLCERPRFRRLVRTRSPTAVMPSRIRPSSVASAPRSNGRVGSISQRVSRVRRVWPSPLVHLSLTYAAHAGPLKDPSTAAPATPSPFRRPGQMTASGIPDREWHT